MTEFLPQRTAIYVEQEDNHLPELTVRETFDFSARCQGVGAQAGEMTLPNTFHSYVIIEIETPSPQKLLQHKFQSLIQ